MDKLMIFTYLFLSVQSQAFDVNVTKVEDSSVVLSRRKRFIVFPEGSSLQLVFCVTYPSLSAIGDIILWGNTAALAYELPQDPYSPFMHHADPLHRRTDSKAIYYTNEDGKVLYKRPYKRKFVVNPAFAKRSADFTKADQLETGIRGKFKIDRKQMHATKNKRDFLKSTHMDGRSVEFHRSTRGVLYQKIETMLQGLGADGRQCLLKTLCLVGQTHQDPQGTFLQEILRAVFTLPRSDDNDDYFSEYDQALTAKGPCDQLYPECDQPLSEPSFASSSLSH